MTLKGLQMLRCLGCCFVIYAHLNPQNMIGFFSLDIFFLISSFFMAMLITMPSKTQESFTKDRVARALPLYWVLTLLVFLIAMFAPSLVSATTVNYGNLLKSLLFIPYYKENGLVDPVLAVGWTINYEIMFYLFCIASFYFRIAWRIPFVMLGVLTLYVVANCFKTINAPMFFYSAYYLLEFPAGMMLWVLYSRYRNQILLSQSKSLTLVVLPLVFMIWADWRWELEVSWLLTFTLPSLVLIWGTLCYEPYIPSNLVTRFAMRVGDASYSIYLTHMFIIEGMRKVMPRLIDGFDPMLFSNAALTFVLCIFVGLLVDAYFDKPFVSGFRGWLKGRGRLVVGSVKP